MAVVNTVLMLLTLTFLHDHIAITEARLDVGVCYGMIANNLPSPAAVVQLYKRYNIGKLRLFDPKPDALAALRGSGIEVTLGTLNQDLQNIASSVTAAKAWFDTNVQPYMSDVQITYLSAGNEVVPGDLAQFVLPAMQNLQSVVNSYGYSGLKITTVVPTFYVRDFVPTVELHILQRSSCRHGWDHKVSVGPRLAIDDQRLPVLCICLRSGQR